MGHCGFSGATTPISRAHTRHHTSYNDHHTGFIPRPALYTISTLLPARSHDLARSGRVHNARPYARDAASPPRWPRSPEPGHQLTSPTTTRPVYMHTHTLGLYLDTTWTCLVHVPDNGYSQVGPCPDAHTHARHATDASHAHTHARPTRSPWLIANNALPLPVRIR